MRRAEDTLPGWSLQRGGAGGATCAKDSGREGGGGKGAAAAQPPRCASWPLETVAQGIAAPHAFRQRQSDFETSLNLQFLFQKTWTLNPTQ